MVDIWRNSNTGVLAPNRLDESEVMDMYGEYSIKHIITFEKFVDMYSYWDMINAALVRCLVTRWSMS